jgi:hypothetical protein
MVMKFAITFRKPEGFALEKRNLGLIDEVPTRVTTRQISKAGQTHAR